LPQFYNEGSEVRAVKISDLFELLKEKGDIFAQNQIEEVQI